MSRQRHSSYLPPIITLAVAGFVGLIVIFALDEYWDLPARSFGDFLKPAIRPHEFSIKVVAALLLFITVLGVLRQAILRIQRLSHMLTMCAWCRKVLVNGEWLSIDQFLQQRKNTTSSVGLCPDCYSQKVAANPASQISRSAAQVRLKAAPAGGPTPISCRSSRPASRLRSAHPAADRSAPTDRLAPPAHPRSAEIPPAASSARCARPAP